LKSEFARAAGSAKLLTVREVMRRGLTTLLVALAGLLPAGATEVGLIKIKGAIGPATASYIERAIRISGERRYECLVIQLNTPGGLVTSTEEIIQSFYASKVPVVVYVAPSAASATSAGTFITVAADVAAMAPNTRIGAAHPVSLGFSGGGDGSTNSVMMSKAENDLVSLMKNIAERRGRNVKWAESAVRESASITSEEALKLKVVDLIAKDLPDLLAQLNSRQVTDKTLQTTGASISEIPMILRERVFQVLWRPEVMFILMLVAIYGLIGEMSNPGAILPGVVGAIALILVLYMSSILPVNVAGLALIGLAIALFLIDVFAPTHGVLTGGGIVAFFLGALMLFNRSDPSFRLSLGYILPGVVLTAAFFIFVVGKGLRAQRLPVRVGRETMVGKVVPALAPIGRAAGKVFIEGELWNAVSDEAIEKDAPVEVVAVDGLTLRVKRKA
jgi:membrane-bound serine protease (ClpP class)